MMYGLGLCGTERSQWKNFLITLGMKSTTIGASSQTRRHIIFPMIRIAKISAIPRPTPITFVRTIKMIQS